MHRFIIAGFICFLGALPSRAADTPDWMAGYWLSCSGKAPVAENWMGRGSGILLGTNIARGSRLTFEFLRVAENENGGISYFSMPNGAPVTEFVMISHGKQRVVFENREHDFPQRVIYHREGDMMKARIEGVIRGQNRAQEWDFRLSPPDEMCPSR